MEMCQTQVGPSLFVGKCWRGSKTYQRRQEGFQFKHIWEDNDDDDHNNNLDDSGYDDDDDDDDDYDDDDDDDDDDENDGDVTGGECADETSK